MIFAAKSQLSRQRADWTAPQIRDFHFQYKLTVPKLGCVADLCKALSRLTRIAPDRMVVTDVYNHKFHKVFSMDEALSHILDRDDIFM